MDNQDYDSQIADDKDIEVGNTVCDSKDNKSKLSKRADKMSEKRKSKGDNTSELGAEVAEWKDKYMRLNAEFDNYRKRTLKEKMDLVSYGGEDAIKSMLTIADDFDRALVAIEKSNELEAVKEGVRLIAHKLNDTLKSKGVSEIESMGMELDTDVHEAIAKFHVEEEELKGKVIDVIQKGYKLKDKIIRYAKVVVGE